MRPRFTDPMYARVVALSVDYLVPGVGAVPDNTLGLLEINPAMRVLFISGYHVPPASNPIVRDFLSKPFTAAELLGRVRQVVERPLSQHA